VLKSAQAAGTRLSGVGLAAMRAAPADKDARLKNQYFSEAISEFGIAGVNYVEPWKLNPDAQGNDKFSSYGPDQTGKMVQIRASDGEHFTAAGDLLVAAYLLPKMLATLNKGGTPICTGEGQP
jgi:hypothetical protein